jgi:hypothetical protein
MVWLTNRSGRSVLADDGEAIRLTFCNEAVAVVAVTLPPRWAVALASVLIAAALPGLR